MAVQYCNYDIKGTLAVAGSSTFDNVTLTDLYVDQYIYHNGDTDTFIRFLNNRIIQQAGSGNSKIDFHDNGQLYLYSGGSSTLILDNSQNATFAGAIAFNGSLNSTGNLIMTTASSGANIELYTNGQAFYDGVSHSFRDSDASPTYFSITASQVNSFVKLSVASNKIIDLATPTISTDAANKAYVDTAVSGVSSGVTSIATTNGITGGTITSTGTIQVDSTVVRTTGAQSIAGTKTFTTRINVDTSAGNEAMGLFTENNTAAIADTFSGNTSKSYIYFTPVAGSNDPGFIMHESSATETNEGVLHLVPSDDNATNDYVSIHGTNDPDAIRLHTSGLIETGSNYQLQIKSGSGSIYLNDGVSIEGDLSVSGGDITLGGTGRIQGVDTVSASTDAANKAYVDAHVSPAGTYLPLVGGTMSGNIAMGDNDIDGIDELKFSSGTKLGDVGGTNYMRLTYANSNNGGIQLVDNDGQVQGYLYGDGGATSSFGLLDGTGSWAVRCLENQYVELRYDNSAKLLTLTDGVYVAGKLGIGTSTPDTDGYSYFEDLVIKAGASSADGAGITIDSGSRQYGGFAFRDSTGFQGEIFYDHTNESMNFKVGGQNKFSIATSSSTVVGDLNVNGGDVILGGTGRIQGIDTVSVGTDATSKTYVDNAINTAVTGVLKYDGVWNASTNSPTLSSGSGTVGEYYIVSVAGSTNLDGITDWAVGDWAVFSDQATDAWQKIDNTQVGNVTGSGSNTRLAVWNSASNITSDSGLTFNTSTNLLTIGGQVNWSGGSSAESNDAYDNTITGFSDSGSSTITLTLTQRDGGTLTTSFSNPQGTVTGTGTNNRIALWNGTTAIDSDSDFYVDGDTIFTTNLEANGNISVADDINITNAGGVVSFTGSGYIGAADNFYVGGASNGTDHTYIGDNGRNVTIYNGATLTISGALNLQTLSNATTDTNAFLVSDSGEVKYRTGSQLLSDIGGAPATGGSYLPLTAGSTKPLTGDLYLAKATNQGQLFFGTANANYEIFGGGTFGYVGYNTDGYHRFLIQGAEKMRIHSNSNVGIGQTLPNAKLDVTGDLNDNWAGRFENTNSGGYGILAKIAGTSANERIFEARVGNNAKMLITGDGNATFANDILPVNTGASDLGSSSKRFGSLFVNGISTGTITPTTIELQGSIKLLNKAQTAYIDFATRNTSGSETVMDITNAGSATFSGNISAGNGTFTGDVTADQILTTSNGLGVNVRIGDDVFLGDINVANTMRISGNQDSSKGFITFGNNNTTLGRSGTGALTWGGNFVVSGGDISLGGTGRIQGVDTVSAGTDAANKDYVDTAVAGSGSGSVTGVSSSTTSQLTVSESSPAPALSIVTAAVTNGGTALATGDQIYDATTARLISYLPLAGGTITGNVRFLDSDVCEFGASGDLRIYHASNDSYVDNLVGDLYFTNTANDKDISFRTDDGSGGFTEYLRIDGQYEQVYLRKDMQVADGKKIMFGDTTQQNGDLQIYHNGTNSYLENITGDLYIQNSFQDRDIILQSDDGGGGTATYFQIDGSTGTVSLNYYGSKRLETTNDGVAVTGDLDLNSTAKIDWANGDARIIEGEVGGYSLSFDIYNGVAATERVLLLEKNKTATFSGDIALSADSSIILDDTPTASTASGSGTIVNWSVSESTTAGTLYVVKTNGGWTTADADSEAKSTAMAAIALGSNATSGMLLQGFFYKASHGFAIGSPLYISNTPGAFSNTRPTGTGDYVRIIGYATSANYIYFDPDKTWVKID